MKGAALLVMVCLLAISFSGLFTVPAKGDLSSDWGSPVLLGPSAGGPYDPVVDMNSNGTAVAAWTNEAMMVSMYFAGSGWTAPLALDSSYPSNYFPDVAISDGGNATVVWCAWGAPYDVLACRYETGNGWESPVLLNALAYDPKVAMDDDGNAIVVYRDANGSDQNTWAVRFNATTGWESPVKVQNGSGDVDVVDVAMDDTGNATAVWTEYTGARYAVMASRYTKGANWSSPEPIDSTPYSARWTLDVAMDSWGNAVASWNQWAAVPGIDVWANVYTVGAGWSVAQLLEDTDLPDYSPPDVCMNDNGQAVVSWSGGEYGNGSVYHSYVNRLELGVGWSGATVIEDDDVDPAYECKAVIDDTGEIVAAWYTEVQDPASMEIRSARYTPGTGWEDWVVVGLCSPFHGIDVNMATDGTGSAVVVWNDDGARAAMYQTPEHSGAVETTDESGVTKSAYVQGQDVYVDVSALHNGIPADVEVKVSLEDLTGVVHDYFTTNTSDPVVGWYNSSEASLVETLRTSFFINGYEESFNVVVEVVSSGYEIARTTIVVETQGLRFDPDDSWYWPNELVNVTLVTSHTADLFYVRIVNATGSSAGFNWTAQMTGPDGHWQVSFVVPDSWPSGGYMMEVRSQADSSLWHFSVFNVMNGPPTADAGPDQSGTAGGMVFFDGSGSSDDGEVVNWTWTFEYGGDVVELYGVSPSFQFDDVGTYNVTLNVVDAAGNNASDTMVVTVEAVIPEFGAVWAVVLVIMASLLALTVSRRRRRVD